MSTVLDGLRVVEIAAHAAGPYGAMLLADIGAEVIKVEPPAGEASRYWGGWQIDKKSFTFLALNRNKKSVPIDLKTTAGREQVHRLVATADVVLEALRPGDPERFDLDYESCKKTKHDIIYCSVSGYGRTGPMSGEGGTDMMLQAYTGIMSFTGEPGRPPVRMAVSAIDLMTGTLAFGSVLAALRERDRSGAGQRIEVSLYDTAMNLLLWAVPQYTTLGKLPEKWGGEFEPQFPYGVFEAADDYFVLVAALPATWPRFCAALGLDDLTEDPRFADNPARLAHRDELRAILSSVFARYTVDELISTLRPAGVPIERIRTVADAVGDPHAKAREIVRPLPGYPNIYVPATPFKLERGMVTEWTDPPDLGNYDAESAERHS